MMSLELYALCNLEILTGMVENRERDFFVDEEEKQSVFSLQNIWSLFCLNWYWVLISALLCLTVAFVYLRYKEPVYSASMKVLVKDAEQKNRGFSGMMALDEMGLMSNSNGFDNELEIIRSVAVAKRVVKHLKLYVSYFQEGRFVNRDLYKSSPILVDLEEERLEVLPRALYMEIIDSPSGCQLNAYFDDEDPKKITYSTTLKDFPATIDTKFGMLSFQRNPIYEAKAMSLQEEDVNDAEKESFGKLMITIYPVKDVARSYAKRLSAAPTSKTTTVANVGILDTRKARALDYLRELVKCYNEDANEDKNEVALRTEEFIGERLAKIRAELDETEGGMEAYKRDNELINLSNDATSALTNYTNYQKERVEMQTQLSLVKSLLDYMDSPQNFQQIIPVNLGLNNASLVKMITEYNELVLKRNRFLKGSSEENPMVLQLSRQISDMWPSIRSNMGNIYENMETQRKSIDEQYKLYSNRIAQTPTQERVLTNIDRQRSLKSDLYLTLLQKREENYIQLYSTASKARVIDEPIISGKVSPKSQVVLLAALVLGCCLPIAILICMNLLRFRIGGREDVEQLTKLPILADIPKYATSGDTERAIVVRENRNDMMEEAFRGLRTNMNFVLKPSEKVIMVTSCIPGEGKTFVATNLAMSLALLNKKVLIVGLDIRKPRLVNLFGIKADKRGIVNFLNSDEADFNLLEEQITPSGVNKNMYVLPAGIIPPNPAELLSSTLLNKGIEYLSTKYDYIILDTPPIGLVADTLTIGQCACTTLLVARADYTPKSNFALINEIVSNNKLPKCNIVLNSIDVTKRKYGYYYGRGKYGRYGHYGMYGHYGNGDKGSSYTEK
jgi:capsular exopolysaccharide synthesis family protein